MLVEISIILLLIIANGVFASAEAAMIAARRGRLQQRADDGELGASVALQLQADPNSFLSTVQVGISLIGTIAGAFGGASIAVRLADVLSPVPFVGPYAESVAFTLVVVIITYLSLVIGELAPKRLALQSADAIATNVAQPMLLLSRISRPIIVALTWSTNGVLALLGRSNAPEENVTEEDIRHLVREGAQDGAVELQEQQWIERIFQFGDRAVRHIMTQRMDVHMVDISVRLGDVIDDLLESGYSRFPVYEQNLDRVVGVVHVRDLLRLYRTVGEQAPIWAAMTSPLFVPENSRAVALLATFRRQRRHLAVVLGEMGGVEGIVTMEDVLEEIVGAIPDEYDEVEARTVFRREDGSLLIDGLLPIDQLKRYLNVDELPEESAYRYDTLAGFVISLIGRMPQVGDVADWNDWRFEIVDMDGLRVDKVLVSRTTEG